MELLRMSLLLVGIGLFSMPIAADLTVKIDKDHESVDVAENGQPVLRYSYGPTTPPDGIGPEYARGDYISALYGPLGELITEDYPADHPHHRAVNWSWATLAWQGEMRDMFAVRGAWARPVSVPQCSANPKRVLIEANNKWMWDDKERIVDEHVRIRVVPQTDQGRLIDIEIELTPVVEGLSFCGRIEAGYSGFNVRMAPGEGQQIVFFTDPEDAMPRRFWADYSAEFQPGKGRCGLAILQHRDNPGYPNEWREYPQLNYFQPIYPGGKLIPMPKSKTITLKYGLWIHAGAADAEMLSEMWRLYNQMQRSGSAEEGNNEK